MCKNEEYLVLPSAFDDMSSNILAEYSHLNNSSRIYVRSESYNVICYILKRCFNNTSSKIGNCIYMFDSDECRSIIFKDDEFYSYFVSDKTDIKIVSIKPDFISEFDLFNKSVYWLGDYYKLIVRDKNLKAGNLYLDYCRKEGYIVRQQEDLIKFFISFVDCNLSSFSSKVQLINFAFFSVVFNGDRKIYDFYNNNEFFGKENFDSELNYLLSVIDELYINRRKGITQDFNDLSISFENLHFNENYKYTNYFFNCLILTFRRLSTKNSNIHIEKIMEYLFTN